MLLVGVVLGVVAGVIVGLLTDKVSFGVSDRRQRGARAGWSLYALQSLRAQVIAGWALRRAFRSLGLLLPLLTRALPMLLLFITFLFINAEVWQVASVAGRRSAVGQPCCSSVPQPSSSWCRGWRRSSTRSTTRSSPRT